MEIDSAKQHRERHQRAGPRANWGAWVLSVHRTPKQLPPNAGHRTPHPRISVLSMCARRVHNTGRWCRDRSWVGGVWGSHFPYGRTERHFRSQTPPGASGTWSSAHPPTRDTEWLVRCKKDNNKTSHYCPTPPPLPSHPAISILVMDKELPRTRPVMISPLQTLGGTRTATGRSAPFN